jgi:hypothetical protein
MRPLDDRSQRSLPHISVVVPGVEASEHVAAYPGQSIDARRVNVFRMDPIRNHEFLAVDPNRETMRRHVRCGQPGDDVCDGLV